MQHIINVNPVECQPQWPVNDNHPPLRKRDVAIGLFCLLVSGIVAVAGFVALLALAGAI